MVNKHTPEQIEQHAYEMAARNIALLPNPSYFFQVGEHVQVGNLDDCIIENVLHDGKLYRISCTVTNHNYGSPIVTHGKIMFFDWLQVRPFSTSFEELVENEDIFITSMNQEVSSLFTKVYHFGLNVDAKYQRGYVWTLEDERSLISSMFKNIDIGKFLFIDNEFYEDGASYTIVDGKQRLHTLCRYFENRFSWEGYFFNELPRRAQQHFKGYKVAVGEVSRITEQQAVRLFLKVNETGRPQSQEHMDKVRALLDES